jgi:hypothetical protein
MTKPDYLVIITLADSAQVQQAITALNGRHAFCNNQELCFGVRQALLSQAQQEADEAVRILQEEDIAATLSSVKYLSFRDYAQNAKNYS